MHRMWVVLAVVALVVFMGLPGVGAVARAHGMAQVYKQSDLLAQKYSVWSESVCGSRAVFVDTSNTDPIGGYPTPIPPENRAVLRELIHELKEKYGVPTVDKYLYDILEYKDKLVAFLVPGAPDGLVRDLQALLPEAAEKLGVEESMIVILDMPRGSSSPGLIAASNINERLGPPYALRKIDPHLGIAVYDKKLGIIRVTVDTKDPDVAFRAVGKLLEEKGLCGVPVLIYEIPQLKPLPLPVGNNTQGTAHSPGLPGGSEPDNASTRPITEQEPAQLLLGSLATVVGAILLVLAYLRG